jgi:steroid delta-isomerase-like uncharacterized protein
LWGQRAWLAFSLIVNTVSDLVHRFYDDLWNRWDDVLVERVLSPGFEFRGSLGTETAGRDGWRAYRDTVRAGSADFHNRVVTLVAEEGRAAARLIYSGTHTGTMLGLPATGRRFEYAGTAFFTSADRLLTSAWVLGDLDGLRRQLS